MKTAPGTVPFADWIGITELELAQDGAVRLQVAQRHELNNRRGVVHGGVLATVLDSAMARAARQLGEGVELGGTVDLHVQYMQPAEGRLVATGRVESSSRTLAFCRGQVHDAQGHLVASATATMHLRRPR